MATPRFQQVDLEATPYYHCMTRCVRQGYICGVDSLTGRDYTHRKQWIVDRITELGSIYAIKVCNYSVMDNHYHIVLHVNEALAKSWSDEEVLDRWERLCPNKVTTLRLIAKSDSAKDKVEETIKEWRRRLTSISWFMKDLNQAIAKRSNKEDGTKGRFWDSRFKSQSLLDEAAVLGAMVYVDLNPVRAGMVDTPEESEFTSIYERIKHVAKQVKAKGASISATEISALCDDTAQLDSLMKFASPDNSGTELEPVIDYYLSDYIELLDATGRVIRDKKRGAIPENFPPVFERLGITADGWVDMVKGIEHDFSYAVGNQLKLDDFNNQFRKRRLRGSNLAERYYQEIA